MKILGISGSLRSISKNAALVRAARMLAPAGVELLIYEGLGQLPLFNPDLDDLDNGRAPEPVLEFRAELRSSAGVFISSPEYAHGVSGAMKNALDWLVGSGEFEQKPTVLLNASPGSVHAHAALLETLRTMGGIVIDARLPNALGGRTFDESRIEEHPAIRDAVQSALTSLLQTIAAQAAPEASPPAP
jgi:chromate reductase